ncbi:hypothetical protein [Agrobacterium pusense]|uniref:hypothetical protein n=1 Tax=Agrobacterium pusense TaxID=648995 RepID=UPI0022B90566|nr:hypothetical protein [Agrobacterium pusense]MCZ7926162.1 hypothetical protein [Agrobacterium pusense]
MPKVVCILTSNDYSKDGESLTDEQNDFILSKTSDDDIGSKKIIHLPTLTGDDIIVLTMESNFDTDWASTFEVIENIGATK